MLWEEKFLAGVRQRNDIAGGDLELDRSWALARGKERERGEYGEMGRLRGGSI